VFAAVLASPGSFVLVAAPPDGVVVAVPRGLVGGVAVNRLITAGLHSVRMSVMPENTTPASPTVYQLRGVLHGVSPLIWRRLLVRADTTIAGLHAVVQAAFGWDGEHHTDRARVAWAGLPAFDVQRIIGRCTGLVGHFASPDTRLIDAAMMTAPRGKDSQAWRSAVRRICLDSMSVSET